MNVAIIIRDTSSNALLCDLPKTAILHAEAISKTTMRFLTSGQTRFAIRLENNAELEALVLLLSQIDVLVERHVMSQSSSVAALPNLEDPAVQEYILRLLFDKDFCEFTSSMKVLLDQFQASIPQSGGSSDDQTEPQDSPPVHENN